MKFNIVNSLHPEAIGDAVASFPMLSCLSNTNEVEVYFSSKAVRPLCRFAKTSEQLLEDAYLLDIQRLAGPNEASGMHLPQTYFSAMQMPIASPPYTWPNLLSCASPVASPYILVAPFSRSDVDGQKLWCFDNWKELLPNLPLPVFGACGLGDAHEDYPVERFFVNRPLEEVVGLLANAAVVITVDNGINWLTQALGRPHILLLPAQHRRTWSCSYNGNAINLPQSISVDKVLVAMRVLLEPQNPEFS